MTLRLVRDEPPKKRRRGARTPLLTPEEEKRFRAAMRNLRDAFGSWSCLAAALDVRHGAVYSMMTARGAVSGEMIVRAMKASGLTLAELLGAPAPAERCRACGQIKRRAA